MKPQDSHSVNSFTKRILWLAIVGFIILLLDQILKIWVKTSFYLGESLPVTSWFELVFVQNNGMAFGWEIGSKLLLTMLRIVAIGFLCFYIWRIYRRPEAKTGYLICLTLITAGALGNIIDCMFYGLIFNNPMPPLTATLFPAGGGYGEFLHGYVVDMLYFPLCEWTWPEWMPFVGGKLFRFFQPVFNLADSAITVGIISLILFYANQISEVPFLKRTQIQKDASENPKIEE